ncbi:hypothetical protein MXB_5629, partial [Myxobolus squamalis]
MVDVERDQRQHIVEICQLGGNDDLISCSYDKGYLPCQAIHICLTCQPSESEEAGICSACSIKCHENHNHLGLAPPGEDKDFICENCADCYPFLRVYLKQITQPVDDEFCVLGGIEYLPNDQCLYLPKNWRANICKCPSCYERYIINDLTFLLEEEDDPEAWYKEGNRRYNPDIDSLYTSLDLAQKDRMTSVIIYYLKMEKELKEFLDPFCKNNQVL